MASVNSLAASSVELSRPPSHLTRVDALRPRVVEALQQTMAMYRATNAGKSQCGAVGRQSVGDSVSESVSDSVSE